MTGTHGFGTVFPHDEHNETLLRNVHPRDWVNPEPAPRYNLVVIGAGTAGLVTAAGAAGLGARVALVERHLTGGDCLNLGCVPSKTLLRSSRAAADFRDAPRYGARGVREPEVDFPAVMERMRRVRAHISRHDSVHRFASLGVDVFLGEGRFSGPDTAEAGGRTLRFAKAVIATGARAAVPEVPGLAEAGFLTNETVFSLTELPRRLLVLGAGPIGCEMAQAFGRLGASVTIVEMGPQFLPREDPDAAGILHDAFRREGIDVRLKTTVTAVEKRSEGIRVALQSDETAAAVTVDAVLIGAGRVPNVEGLNLDAVGVAHDSRNGVTVDDFLRTTNPRIYAAGDVCLPFRFTHTADAAARIVIQNALFRGRKRVSALTIPWCTFTDPEVAHVGIHERDARARGVATDTFTRQMRDVDRAVADGEEEGFAKVYVRKGTDRIVGATIVTRHAGEMINEITLAMASGVGLGKIAGVIHPYPTQADAIRQLGDAYQRTRLSPLLGKILGKWLEWTR
jgi:pyruvate/2-oxoglutarate dehydrogenase complex dihydrolipoamide dehydrogenase (E3) component